MAISGYRSGTQESAKGFSKGPREGWQIGRYEEEWVEQEASPYRAVHDDHCSCAQPRLGLHECIKVHQHRLTHGLRDQWGG